MSPDDGGVTHPETMAPVELARRAALSIVLCDSPARKTRLLGMIADMAQGPVSYMDTDLLYAGCAGAGLCRIHEHTTLLCPDQSTWHEHLAGVISEASRPSSSPAEKTTVIIDSLNGVYEMFGGSDAAMAANAHLMILGSLARQTGFSVVVGAVAKRKRAAAPADTGVIEDAPGGGTAPGGWIMRPGGRQIPKMVSTYVLCQAGGKTSLVRQSPA